MLNQRLHMVQGAAVFLALLGLIDALYLYISHISGTSLVCGALTGCNEVAASPYSVLFGVPLSLWGVIFYGGIFVVTAALFSYYRVHALTLFLVGSILGAFMSAYFIYVQGALIGAWCVYCLFSAFISFVLCVLSLWLFKHQLPEITEQV